jgi:hypothetical protein
MADDMPPKAGVPATGKATETGKADKKSRPRSEKRQRTKLTCLRWFPEEFNKAAARADAEGLSFGAYIRAKATGEPGDRAQRRTPVNQALLLQVKGMFGRYAGNMNQIARALHTGAPDYTQFPELREALLQWAKINELMLEALGKKPGSSNP